MSIRRKLTFTIMGISLAAIALTVSVITTYLIYDMKKERAQELSVTAGVTGDRNSAALVFLDSQKVTSNLEIFQQNPAVVVACIYDASGAMFASYQRIASTMSCPAQAANVVRQTAHMLTAFQPIVKIDETIGSIYLLSDTSAIDAYVKKILLISLSAAICVMFVTWLLTIYFQRTISAPILDLAAKAQRITLTHDYDVCADLSYSDETGVLARAFNEMVGEVKKRDNALLQANETLEEKVAQRTVELEQSVKIAEAASAAKSEFLRNMSHEFRTPLHAITSFSAYGVKEYESAERGELKKYFEIMGRASERLIRLVNQVLDLARMEEGEQPLALQDTHMQTLISRAVELMQPLAHDKQIRLEVAAQLQPVMLSCDADKILQVITNLLGNAVKFTPNGKTIQLETALELSGDAPHVVLSVIDEGIGIPEVELEAVFESFRQSSRTNTGAGGTGLGLAISQGIIRAHHGRIWAENNQSGVGSRVSFTLPLRKSDIHCLTQVEVSYENAA